MESDIYKRLSIIPLLLLLLLSNAYATKVDFSEEEEILLEERMKSMELSVMDIPLEEKTIKTHIKRYIGGRATTARSILNKALIYLPIFEKELEKQGLPTDLKYLPIVESGLKPDAVSPVGAGGLWQFMPATGKSYGLEINKMVDDRSNVIKSTQAAVAYLKHLYDRFGDWSLALAAYNSGAGRVNSAIRKSGSTDFWTLRKYLPRETKNYVPAFIAAAYMVQYHQAYDIQPDLPTLDYQLTESFMVTEQFSFYRIAEITGISIKDIRLLNPGYKRDVIPAAKEGSSNPIILPSRIAPVFAAYLEKGKSPLNTNATVYIKTDAINEQELYSHRMYALPTDGDLDAFSKTINCSPIHLQLWSRESMDQQLVTIYEPNVPAYLRPPRLPEVDALPTLQVTEVVAMH